MDLVDSEQGQARIDKVGEVISGETVGEVGAARFSIVL